ncbi:MAG: TIGR03564 family F420-dependent LLM class oxidoreductase [Gammaproteobacteria bacterium]|nr:TIGR03564 family F420-dependent LLM class oxidoreductase [Gammaproteobacteria bacterium]
MKIGINGTGLVQKASVDAIQRDAQRAADDGFSSYWLAEHPTGGFDALTVLALVGQQVPDIELGTAIVPTMPRHPMVLAGQALTTAAAIDHRLTLGIGLSHEPMMAQLGIGFDKPIRHLREYLTILMALMRDGQADYQGETLSCQAEMFSKPVQHTPVMVAALGPQALKVTGTLADGTSLAWVGPKTVSDHIAPRIRDAAAAAGRPEPRIIATLPVCVTDDPESVRTAIRRGLSMYGKLPSYRAMFEREGVDGPADVAIVGSAAEVQDRLNALAEAGVSDFAASEFTRSPEERAQTRTLLQAQAA